MFDLVIEKVIIYNGGIVVDTLASTEASEKILRGALHWTAEQFRLKVPSEALKRRAYISQLYFYSDAPLLKLQAAFAAVAKICSEQVAENFGQHLSYFPSTLTLQYDPSETQAGPAPFSIQRALSAPFQDKRFYSVAPVRTKIHVELIEHLERELMTAL